MKTSYGHFCLAARTLETVGERWSLLVVRDLLTGPRRFSDLRRLLTNVTPKWLTIRLRQLEHEGIVTREQQPGRREVWYELTEKGRDLAPVLQALVARRQWPAPGRGRQHDPARLGRVRHPAAGKATAALARDRAQRGHRPSRRARRRLPSRARGSSLEASFARPRDRRSRPDPRRRRRTPARPACGSGPGQPSPARATRILAGRGVRDRAVRAIEARHHRARGGAETARRQVITRGLMKRLKSSHDPQGMHRLWLRPV